MKPLFSHDVLNSFFLWFDNVLLRRGEAYKTYTTRFYNYSDSRFTDGKVVYGSPFKQWVYDNNIGATIPSGLTINGSFVPTGTSGLFFDFDNGRAIFNSGVPTGLNISGTYTVKEINSYINDQPEDQLIIDNKFSENSKFTVSETYVEPYNPVTPAVFSSLESSDNEGFALGGMDETTMRIKSIAFCENIYQLDGLLSVFADTYNSCFKMIPMTGHPLGEFGALKTGVYPTGYDYSNAAGQGSYSDPCFIYDVNVSKIRDSAQRELNPNLYIGFIEFSIGKLRYPRI